MLAGRVRACDEHHGNRTKRLLLGVNLLRHPKTLGQKLRRYISTLNTFEKMHKSSVTEHELYFQRQSTRVYLLVLISAVLFLVGYTLFTYQKRTSTIRVSSFQQLQRLQNQYGSKEVDCPCTTISFHTAAFCHIEPVFHPICTSDFVGKDWLEPLFYGYKNQRKSDFNPFTLTGTAFAYFQSLRVMCDLAKQAVLDSRDLFLARQIVSAEMPDQDIFDRLVMASLASFRSTLATNLVHTLHMLLGIAQSNGLVSAYATNWGLFLPNMSKDATIYTKARHYNGCNCATSPSCTQPSFPYVPGYVVGCLPLQSLLRSTFECLYNQSCVDAFAAYFNATKTPRSLNAASSRFAANTLTNDIVEAMFIEAWSSNISYASFFEQCHPAACSYKSIDRYNVLYVVTTIVGLYGGLTVLLKLIVPLVVHRLLVLLRRARSASPPTAAAEERH